MQSKKISVILTIALIVMIAAALSGCSSTVSPTPTAAPSGGDLKAGLLATMDYSVQVIGGTTPVTLTYADLKNMEFTELKGVTTVNSVGTVTAGDYIGVPLMDIVNKAGLPAGEVSFKVTASDGYVIDYTKEQFTAGILAFKTNGTANVNNINDPNAIAFVIPGELKNMWLKMPTKIQIVGGAAKPVALSISGANVTSRPSFTLDELKNMTQKMITTTDSKNNTITATGVSLNDLLDKAGPKGAVVQFISGDANGFSKNVSLTDIYNSPDAIVAIDENGVLRNIIPGLPSNTWVGNLTKIRID
jgi:DMSO/TMAO reductase YedYZ molybdopterin-dependent catalytic subunit